MEHARNDSLNLVGRVVSHYKILEQLGEGGMGVVYVAEDTRLGRRTALKFLPRTLTSDADAKRRFVHEAQAASALDDQHICTVYEIDENEDGDTFIAMAYYDGENLREVIKRGELPVDRAVEIALQIVEGLEKAHRRGIVHRDIKPANIIITEAGVVKIVDFGLAKLAGRTQITRTGATLGTAAYMAPEQVLGEEVDRRADVWSVGVVLCEMLTGRMLFSGDYEQAIFYRVVHDEPDLVGVPPDVMPIVRKCLQRNPEQRYVGMSELAEDLSQLIADESASSATRRRIPGHSRRVVLGALAVAVVLLAAFLVLPINRSAVLGSFGIDVLPDARHLAVLPFRNVSGDPAGDAYCSGLMEMLTSKLAHLEQFSGERFWVVPASDVLSRSVRSAEEARRVFGATLVIDGSFQRQQETVRLTLNLIDAATRRVLASEVIDPPSPDAIALQDAAIIRVAEMLRVEIPASAGRMLRAGGTFVPGAEEYYLQGRGYLNDYQKAENVETAIGLFERALKEDSTYALAHAGLAEAHWRKFRNTKETKWLNIAIRHGENALAADDMLSAAHVVLGTTYTETGNYDQALSSFQKALEIDPLNADAYRGRAAAFEAQNMIAAAEQTLTKSVELRKSYWAGYSTLGAFYYRQARYDKAAEQFEAVIRLTPSNPRGYANAGGAYFALQRFEEAAAMFERALALEPTYIVYSNLATLYFYLGRYADAAQNYENALSIQDSDFRVWGYLAEAYYWWDDGKDKAQATYREALRLASNQHRINPADPDVLTLMSSYYARLGQEREAREALNQAIATDPTQPQTIARIGEVFEDMGRRREAIQWLTRAVSNGYTLAEIENSPQLADLRRDPRYLEIIKPSSLNP